MMDTVLITGGAGGLGLMVANHLAGKGPVNLILTGRSGLDAGRAARIADLERKGAGVLYLQADVCDRAAMAAGLEAARARFGPVRGVIHAAGVAGTRKLFDQTAEQNAAVLSAKIDGARLLDELLADDPLRYVCYFSSSSAVLGDFGACDYAVANRFLMAYARHRNALADAGLRRGRALAITWPLWRGGGMGFGDAAAEALYLKTSGQRLLEPQEGLALLDRFLADTTVDGPHLVFAGVPGRIHRILGLKGPAMTEPTATAPAGPGRPAHMRGWSLAACVAAMLREPVVELLKVPSDRLDGTLPLADFGFDSISLGDYARRLSALFAVEMTPDVFFGHSTLDALADWLLRTHGPALEALLRDAARPEPAPAPQRDTDVRPVPAARAPEPRAGGFEPIAILGMSGRFAKARSVDELWRILASGEEAITEIPLERFDWRAVFGDLREPGKTNGRWCGLVPGVDEFDPLFFEISPREAAAMDPRQRLLLQEAWNALEDAAYGPSRLARERVGMFVGVEEGDYVGVLAQAGAGVGITGSHTGILAARLAYVLNLGGPVMALNTACSSGLVAVHQACQSLRLGECEAAIAAGVSLMLTPAALVGMGQAGMLSGDGHCRAFARDANGLVPGEAVAAVVLKPLARALADGDPVQGVILGSGVNYDGKTNGITAPSAVAQGRLIRSVREACGVEARRIGHIVTHGTGTALGDPVEIKALEEAFRGEGLGIGACALTSVKGNVGHSFAASGVVSLMAQVLSLRHGTIPASLNCAVESEHVRWGESAFRVNKTTCAWAEVSGGRVGGVSAFGMSGTNAHVLVGEAPELEMPEAPHRPYELLVVSAKSAEGLRSRAVDLARALEGEELRSVPLARIAYSLVEGRHAFRHRAAVVVQDHADAALALAGIGQGTRPDLFHGLVPPVFAPQPGLQRAADALAETARREATDREACREALYALADLYCQGYEVRAASLFGEWTPPRVRLPTYPFLREHHGGLGGGIAAAVRRGGAVLHPLLHRNTSGLSGLRFTTTLTGAEPWLDRSGPAPTVPAGALLEMARRAVDVLRERAGEAVVLADVAWGAPVRLEQGPLDLHITLAPEPDGLIWEIHSAAEGAVIHLQGLAPETGFLEDAGIEAGDADGLIDLPPPPSGFTLPPDLLPEALAALSADGARPLPLRLRRIWFAPDGGHPPVRLRLRQGAGATVEGEVLAQDGTRIAGLSGLSGASAGSAAAACVPDADLPDFIRADLRRQISQLLQIPEATLETDAGLADIGFDSVSLAAFARALSARYGLEITPDLFFAWSSLGRLADYFLAEHEAAMAAFHGLRTAGAAPSAAPLPRLEPLRPHVRQGPAREPLGVAGKSANALLPSAPVPAQDAAREPIAILGMSGRFPKARDVEALWEILTSGQSAIAEIPADRFDWRPWFHADGSDPAKGFGKWCGILPGVAEFDPLFFEISPAEAAALDPRQRLWLQEAWRALEHAGQAGDRLAGTRVGVFVGVEEGDYQRLAQAGDITSNHVGILAARLAYFLDLRGPALAINTACSSALVALHQACAALRAGDCDLALVAGVNLMLTPEPFVAMSHAGMLSPTGRCAAFDQEADGIVPGEAVAVVVLRRLSRAQAEGDPILATIIGDGINYDGRTTGITAPSRIAQAELVREVMARAKVSPGEIDLIVTHGTGTRLGDPVEVNALMDAFKGADMEPGPCALVSTKPHLGHCFAASGLVSLIALVEALRRRVMPASLNCRVENEYIAWRGSPFHVNRQARPWPWTSARPAIGAVSAFGMSGTNAHVLVQGHAAPEPECGQPVLTSHLLVLSAKTPQALQDTAAVLAAHLDGPDWNEADLPAIAHTLLEGRAHFRHRAALVVSDLADAVRQLTMLGRDGIGRTPDPVPRDFKPGAADARAMADMQARCAGAAPEQRRSLLAALGEFYGRGHRLSSAPLTGNARCRVNLPGYVFARERYWSAVAPRSAPRRSEPLLLAPVWRPVPAEPPREDEAGAKVLVWWCGPTPPAPDMRAILPASVEREADLAPAYEALALRVFHELRALLAPPPAEDLLIQVLVPPQAGIALARGLIGLLRTAEQENPALRIQLIEPGTDDPEAVRRILAQDRARPHERCIRHGPGGREVLDWEPVTDAPERGPGPWRADGVYLITGGAGGLGRGLAAALLARQKGARIVLAGRSPEPPGLTDPRITYRAADVTDPVAVEALLAGIRASHGVLHGILHCAGLVRDGAMVRKDDAAFRAVLAPKVAGTLALARAGGELDFLVLFASTAGVLGNAGQADYAAANGFLDLIAAHRAGQGPCLSIDWPLWRDGGMGLDAERTARLARLTGLEPLDMDAGFAALERALRLRRPQVMVLHGDHDRLLAALRSQPAEAPPAGSRLSRAEMEGVIREVLMLPADARVDADATFTELGLDSIHGVRFIQALSRRLGRALRETLIFDHPTLAALAAHLEAADARPADDPKPARSEQVSDQARAVPGSGSNQPQGAGQNFEIQDPEGNSRTSSEAPMPAPASPLRERLAAVRARHPEVVPLALEGEGPLLFCFPPMSGDVGLYGRLGGAGEVRLVGLRSRGFLTEAEPLTSMDAMARHDAGLIRAIDPAGPWHLLGTSMGGTLAYETARLLQAHGRVETLILLEAPLVDSAEAAAPWTTGEAENLLMNANFLLIGMLHLDPDFRRRKAAGEARWPDLEIRARDLTGEVTIPALVAEIARRGVRRDAGELARRLASMAAIHRTNLAALAGYRAGPLPRPAEPAAWLLRTRDAAATSEEVYNPDYLVAVQARQGGLAPSLSGWSRLLPTLATRVIAGAGHFDLLDGARGALADILQPRADAPEPRRADPPAPAAEAVAVIGMSGRFPGADTLADFLALLREDRCAITPVPQDRGWAPDACPVTHGGFLKEIDRFDPVFFRIPPAEAVLMDPAERLLLMEAWRAIEDAGVDPARLSGAPWGVFCGGGGDYTLRLRDLTGISPHVTQSAIPGRVAYGLDLAGPSVAVDAGCASSLLAVAQACDALSLGHCEVAVAGGVMIHSTPNLIRAAAGGGTLSRGAYALALDRRADGMLPGEGVAVLVLKPLKRALADGDRIHGVIEGWGHMHSGRTNGMAAPSARAQAAVMAQVHRRFGIDAGQVGLVEANATGTPLGDRVEVEALAQVLGHHPSRWSGRPVLGSVENHIGHAYQCSGLAHLLKALLAIEHRLIPGTLHVEQPVAETAPFELPASARPWEPERPRRALVNSFGATGCTVHLVVAAAPDPAVEEPVPDQPELILLSAPDEALLRRRAVDLAEALETPAPDVTLRRLSATLWVRRGHHACRRVLVVSGLAGLRAALRVLARGEEPDTLEPDLAPDPDLLALARRYEAGAIPDPGARFTPADLRPLSLPPLPFVLRHCWLEPDAPGVIGEVRPAFPSGRDESRGHGASGDQRNDAHGASDTPSATSGLAVLTQVLAQVTGYADADLDPARPLRHYGLDSLMSLRLLAQLNDRLGLDLQLADLIGTDTLQALADLLEQRLANGLTAGGLEPFQEKCDTLFRPELRKNKDLEYFRDSEKSGNALDTHTGAGLTEAPALDLSRAGWLADRLATLPAPLTLVPLRDAAPAPSFLSDCRALLDHLAANGIGIATPPAGEGERTLYLLAHRAVDVAARLEGIAAEAFSRLPAGLLFVPAAQEQERNLFHSEVLRQPAWNVQHIHVPPHADLDPARLQEAARRLALRHDLLRTRFLALQGERWGQVVEEEPPVLLTLVEAPSLPAFRRMVAEERAALLPVDMLPLLRIRAARIAGRWYFGFIAHHAVADAFTSSLLFRELMALHDGVPLPAPPSHYWQYALIQAGERGQGADAGLAYWRRVLTPGHARMRLPFRRDPTEVEAADLGRAAGHAVMLAPELNTALDGFCRDQGLTMTQLFLAALGLILVHGMGNGAAGVRLAHTRRDHLAVLDAPGEFTNVLFLPLQADPAWRVETYLHHVRQELMEALRHGRVPFAHLLRLAGYGGLADYHQALGDVMVDSADLDTGTGAGASSLYAEGLAGLGAAAEEGAAGQAVATLFFQILRIDGHVHLVASWRQALFARAEMHGLLALVVALAARMARDPQGTVADVLAEAAQPLATLRQWTDRFAPAVPQDGRVPLTRPPEANVAGPENSPEPAARPPVFAECQRVNPVRTGRPVFWVHGAFGDASVYLGLAARIDRPFYGLQARGLVDDKAPLEGVETIAAFYRSMIQAIQPAGPYDLGGYSVGGALAYEIARQLMAAGEQVHSLTLADPLFPPCHARLGTGLHDLYHFLSAGLVAMTAGRSGIPSAVAWPDRRIAPDALADAFAQACRAAGVPRARSWIADHLRRMAAIQAGYQVTSYDPAPLPGAIAHVRYFRNRHGRFFGAADGAPDPLEGVDYWSPWRALLPNLIHEDVDIASHLAFFDSPAALEAVARHCRTVYGTAAPEPAAPAAGAGQPSPDRDRVRALVAELLHVPAADLSDDTPLADHGLESLATARLLQRLRTDFGRDFDLATLSRLDTVARIAEVLAGDAPAPDLPRRFPELVALNRGHGRPVFWFHGGLGGVEAYATLAQRAARPFFGIQARGWMSEHAPLRGVAAMAAYDAHIIRAVQPHGPYDLGGYSLGGVLAYEVTRLLQEQGERVDTLVMLDSYDVLETSLGAHFRKRAMLGAVNMALRSQATGPLIHRDELNLSVSDEDVWHDLIALARQRGLARPLAQVRASLEQMEKLAQSLAGDTYMPRPLPDPQGVRAFYFRNASGRFYGELAPFFTLEDQGSVFVDGMTYWQRWIELLPSLRITDVPSPDHTSLLSDPRSASIIAAFCARLYGSERMGSLSVPDGADALELVDGAW